MLDRLASRQTAEAVEPRFRGELLGIALAPSLEELPPGAQEEHARLAASGGCVAIPVEEAAALAPPRPLVLPAGYTLRDGFPQATACGGNPSGLSWEFTSSRVDTPTDISIVRSIVRYDTTDAPASSVSVREIGGRQAVLVSPATPDGLAQRSAVYFPEPVGMTAIYAFSLPVDELLKVAEAVAEATR